MIGVSKKYFSKNLKPIVVVIMNVSGIFTLLARRTHEFSLKFHYNRFATSIGKRDAEYTHECRPTRAYTTKYLFDSVPQGHIDCVRSSLDAYIKFARILKMSRKSCHATSRIAEENRPKIYSNSRRIYIPTLIRHQKNVSDYTTYSCRFKINVYFNGSSPYFYVITSKAYFYFPRIVII